MSPRPSPVPEAEQATATEVEELRVLLMDLRSISNTEKELSKHREAINLLAVPLMRKVGSLLFTDPTNGTVKIANVRAPETLVVNAGDLLDALIEQEGGDIEMATVIWEGTLKAPAVDTKDDGLFHHASMGHGEEPAKITPETVAKVATYKASKAYIGYAKPGG